MLVFTYPSNAGTLRSPMAAGSARATTVKMHRSSQLVAQPLVETGGGASPVGSPTKTSVAEVFTLASDADSVLKEAADRAVDAIVGVYEARDTIDEPSAAARPPSVPLLLKEQKSRQTRGRRERSPTKSAPSAHEPPEGPSAVELAALEVLIPPTFGFPEVEAVQESFVRQFTFKREARDYANAYAQPRGIQPRELEALRKKLTERSMVRFVGLVCHLLYWNVLRPEFERSPLGGSRGHGAGDGPTEHERATLFTEVLGCHAQIHAEMRSSSKHVDTVLVPVLHLALRCGIERLFTGAYRWFAVAGPDAELMLATFHDHLAGLFDPQNYHSQFVSAAHGDRFTRPAVSLATDRAARLRGRTAATSSTLRALYPAPASPRVRKMLRQTGGLREASGDSRLRAALRAGGASVVSASGAPRAFAGSLFTSGSLEEMDDDGLSRTSLPTVAVPDAPGALRISKEGRTQLLRRLQHHIGHEAHRPPGRNTQELAALSRKKYHDLVRRHNAMSTAKRASWQC